MAALNGNHAVRDYYPLNTQDLELKFARFVLDNLFGPPTDPLSIQGRVEVWDGAKFVRFSADSCTAFTASQVGNVASETSYEPELQPQSGSEQTLNMGELFDPSLLWTRS